MVGLTCAINAGQTFCGAQVGYRHIPKLREALKRELKIEAKTSTVSKKKVA